MPELTSCNLCSIWSSEEIILQEMKCKNMQKLRLVFAGFFSCSGLYGILFGSHLFLNLPIKDTELVAILLLPVLALLAFHNAGKLASKAHRDLKKMKEAQQ
jgi:hypothetical protein